jgi:hypothetical protein
VRFGETVFCRLWMRGNPSGAAGSITTGRSHRPRKASGHCGDRSADHNRVRIEAWEDIATDYVSPLAVQAARLKLANVVLSLAADGVRDGEKLRAEGARVMRLDKA